MGQETSPAGFRSGSDAQEYAVEGQTETAQEQERRQIRGRRRVDWNRKIHGAVAAGEIVNHGGHEHQEETAAKLAAFCSAGRSCPADFRLRFAAIRTLRQVAPDVR